MPIVVSCECGMKFHARDEHAGRRAKCLDCGRILVVPNAGVAPAAQRAPTGLQETGATPPPPPGEAGGGQWPSTQSLAAPGTPLIYTDYGIPYAQLSRPAAKLQSLKYFNERWVTVGTRSVLRRQRAVIRGMRLFVTVRRITWSGSDRQAARLLEAFDVGLWD